MYKIARLCFKLSVHALTFMMATHLTRDRPKPDMAPRRPATVWVMHNDASKPSQLKTKATKTHNIT